MVFLRNSGLFSVVHDSLWWFLVVSVVQGGSCWFLVFLGVFLWFFVVLGAC